MKLLWRERFKRMGLLPLVGVGLDVLEPVSPFMAQTLYVLQPTLGLFIEREQINHWANTLENPERIAQLRDELLQESSNSRD